MLQASRLESDQQASEASQHQQRLSSGSTASSSSAPEQDSQSSSNWWHAADTYLQQAQQDIGPLESHQAQEMAKDVTTLLTRIVNARVMRGYDPTATQLVDLAVFQLGVKASADPAVRIGPPRTDFSINIRQRLFRDATAVALEACAQSAAGKQSSAWHELASNWASKGGSNAGACTSTVTGRLAQMFLRSLAELFKLDRVDVERIVHAAVAAHTRARLLDAVAAVKQVNCQSYYCSQCGKEIKWISSHVASSFPSTRLQMLSLCLHEPTAQHGKASLTARDSENAFSVIPAGSCANLLVIAAWGRKHVCEGQACKLSISA